MRRPVRPADLVADQQVGGLGIGHPQERLCEAEQRDPFLRIEPILVQEAVNPPLSLRRTQIGEQPERPVLDPLAGGGFEGRGGQQRAHDRRLGGAVEGAHLRAGGCQGHGRCI